MKKLILIATFIFSVSDSFAGGMYYALASFRCNNDYNKAIFVRGKYAKNMDSENAPDSEMRAYVWHSTRQLLEADNTTIQWNCGTAGATGKLALYDMTEDESKLQLAAHMKNCNENSASKLCLDKSPWTGYKFPAFDSNIYYGNGEYGGNDSGQPECHRVRYLRCVTPERHAVDFFFHYKYRKSTFGINKCDLNILTLGSNYYWNTFLPKEFEFVQKLAVKRFHYQVDKCKKPVQWMGTPYSTNESYPTRQSAIDYIENDVYECRTTTNSVSCNMGVDFEFTKQDLQ